ncbi:hypothetical protein HK097_010157 [Rhizophlyctis rosea]|uniref:Uncharacterized protein n=1 Tax=Rhizophlyctis rosea TaxID=64517 RepID=A0AAD5SKG3_9FUNG|nr:hypothetical protein HK097_010157 [Rhizophlyctis rosea]
MLDGGGPSSARSGAAQGGPSSGYNGVPGTSAQRTTAKKRSVHSKAEQSRAKKVKRDPSDSDQDGDDDDMDIDPPEASPTDSEDNVPLNMDAEMIKRYERRAKEYHQQELDQIRWRRWAQRASPSEILRPKKREYLRKNSGTSAVVNFFNMWDREFADGELTEEQKDVKKKLSEKRKAIPVDQRCGKAYALPNELWDIIYEYTGRHDLLTLLYLCPHEDMHSVKLAAQRYFISNAVIRTARQVIAISEYLRDNCEKWREADNQYLDAQVTMDLHQAGELRDPKKHLVKTAKEVLAKGRKPVMQLPFESLTFIPEGVSGKEWPLDDQKNNKQNGIAANSNQNGNVANLNQKQKTKKDKRKDVNHNKKGIRDVMKRTLRSLLSFAGDLENLTIDGRPDVLRFCLREPPKLSASTMKFIDDETYGIIDMLKNLRSLNLSNCQTAGTDFRLQWIFEQMSVVDQAEWAKVGVYRPDTSKTAGDDKRKEQKAENKKNFLEIRRARIDHVRHNLQSLKLRNCHSFTYTIFDEIAEKFPHLKELDLTGNIQTKRNLSRKANYRPAFEQMCWSLRDLKTFRYSPRFEPNRETMWDILGMESLETLELHHLDRVANGVNQSQTHPVNAPGGQNHWNQWSDIAVTREDVKCSNLKSLILKRSPKRTNLVNLFLEECPNIREVGLVQCGDVPMEVLKAIGGSSDYLKNAKYSAATLTSFSLVHAAGYRSVEAGVKFLIESAPQLKHLSLKSHQNHRIPSLTTETILRAINAHNGLKSIELSYTNMHDRTPAFWTHFASLHNEDKPAPHKAVITMYKFPSPKVWKKMETTFNGKDADGKDADTKTPKSYRYHIEIAKSDPEQTPYKEMDQLSKANRAARNPNETENSAFYRELWEKNPTGKHNKKQVRAAAARARAGQ